MSDETTRKNDRGTAAPAKAATLTDAEANHQLGQGGAPRATTIPEAAQAPDRSAPQPDATVTGCAEETEPFVVGAREVAAPRTPDDAPNGEDSLTDRLARQDRVPVDRGDVP